MPSLPAADAQGLRVAALILLGFLTVVGCSNGPAPRLFLLEAQPLGEDPLDPLETLDSASLQESFAFVSIGTEEVVLPDYAGNDAVMTRLDSGELAVAERLQWAEPPGHAVTRLFAERLHHHTEAQVVTKPWPRDHEPEIRIELQFDHLYRLPDGGASIAGRIHFVSGDGRLLLNVKPFRLSEPGQSTQVRSFFAALARAIDSLALSVYHELARETA